MFELKNEGIEFDINDLDTIIEILKYFKRLRDNGNLEDGEFEGIENIHRIGIGFYNGKIYMEEYIKVEE